MNEKPLPPWRCVWIAEDGRNGTCMGPPAVVLENAIAQGAHSISMCIGDLRKAHSTDRAEVSISIGQESPSMLKAMAHFDGEDLAALSIFRTPTDAEVIEELTQCITGKSEPAVDTDSALETRRLLRAIQIIKERNH